MDINALSQTIAQVEEHYVGATTIELRQIESGFDSIFESIATVSSAASTNSTLVTTLNSLLDTVHTKIDAALHTFIELGSIAATIANAANSAPLRSLYNLMINLIQSLKPVEDLVCRLYPALSSIFALLLSLKPL